MIPPGHLHCLGAGTGVAGEAADELPVALAELVAAAAGLAGPGPPRQAVGRTPVTLPLVRDEVGQVVLQEHAGGRRVAPVVHLTTPAQQILYHLFLASETVSAFF